MDDKEVLSSVVCATLYVAGSYLTIIGSLVGFLLAAGEFNSFDKRGVYLHPLG